jgi:hypothetical protein
VPRIEELAMTTNNPPAVAPRRRGAGPGRVLAIVAAVILILIGACLAFAGTVLMVTFGSDGQVSSAKHPVASPTAAVITDVAAIRATSEMADVLGTPEVNFSADGGNASGLFVGIGRVADVDRYLAGVEIDQATDFELNPYVLTLARRDGIRTTAPPPTEQDFWVASATGTGGVDLSWAAQDGNYRVVLMNADGAAGVDSQLSVGVGLSGMFGLSLGLLIGGVVLILVAIALLVATRPRRVQFPTGPPYAPRTGPAPTGPAPAWPPPAGTAAPAWPPAPTGPAAGEPAGTPTPPTGIAVPTGPAPTRTAPVEPPATGAAPAPPVGPPPVAEPTPTPAAPVEPSPATGPRATPAAPAEPSPAEPASPSGTTPPVREPRT